SSVAGTQPPRCAPSASMNPRSRTSPPVVGRPWSSSRASTSPVSLFWRVDMAGTRIPLMAGNWKMNLDHHEAIALVQKLAWNLQDAKHDYDDVEVAVLPPFTSIRSIQTM